MNTRSAFFATCTVALSALTLAAVALPSASAQDKMGKMGKMEPKMSGGKMMDHKMMAPVYVSKATKMYYSESDAKMMKMMDSKGMKMTKMSKAPMGYKMGHKGGKMMDHKMSGGKMMDHKMPGKM